jgi:hypothetical protein
LEGKIAANLIDDAMVLKALPPGAFALRGAFYPHPADRVPAFPDGAAVGTLVLLGWTGGRQWPAFALSDEANDGEPHPLDRWTRRLIGAAATTLAALDLYPFGGPPYLDFLGWAARAEPVARSPIGLLIHPKWGLWHAYRGALGFRERLELTDIAAGDPPCHSCADKPCLSTCPVSAFRVDGYDVAACARHVNSTEGLACLTQGCAARRACPVQPAEPYPEAQGAFHMSAFARGWQTR